jgi:hypothetical protein
VTLLIVYLLLVAFTLLALLWLGTLVFQGYFYTEPAEQLYWRAPVAAAVLMLLFAVWAMLDVNSRGINDQDLPFNTIFKFSDYVTMTADGEPVKVLWVVRPSSTGRGTETVKFTRRSVPVAKTGIRQFEYKESGTDRPWRGQGVEAILTKEAVPRSVSSRASARRGATTATCPTTAGS